MATIYYDYTSGDDSGPGTRGRPRRNLPQQLDPNSAHLLRDGVTMVADGDKFVGNNVSIGTWDGGTATLVPTGSANSVAVVGRTAVTISNLRLLGGAAGSRQLNISGVTGRNGLVLTNVELDGQDAVLWNARVVNCPGSVRWIDCTTNGVKQDGIYAENCGGLTFEGHVGANPNGSNDFSGDCIQVGTPGQWGFLRITASARRRSSFSNLRNGKQCVIFGGLNCLDLVIEDTDFVGGYSLVSIDTPVTAPIIRKCSFKAALASDGEHSTKHLLLLKSATDPFVVENDFDCLGVSDYAVENWNPAGTSNFYGNTCRAPKTWGFRHYGAGSIASRMVFRGNRLDNSRPQGGDPLAAMVLCGPGHEYVSTSNVWSKDSATMLNVASIVYPTLAAAQAAGYEQGSSLLP